MVRANPDDMDHQDTPGVRITFASGAVRDAVDTRYDLVSPDAMLLLAERLCMGAKKYGDRNWEKGGKDFEDGVMSHLLAHAYGYLRNPNKDDAAGLLCNAHFIAHFQAQREKDNG